MAPFRNHRLGRMALMMGTCGVVAGCGPEADRFAVVLLDANDPVCVGQTRHGAIDQETMAELADDLADRLEDQRELRPASPIGVTLVLTEEDERTQAWFEASAPLDVDFAGPGTVYVGEPHDDWVEASYRGAIDTDRIDRDLERETCGARWEKLGVLQLTKEEGVNGRIRWFERTFVETVDSSCAAWIDCSRDVTVDGLKR